MEYNYRLSSNFCQLNVTRWAYKRQRLQDYKWKKVNEWDVNLQFIFGDFREPNKRFTRDVFDVIHLQIVIQEKIAVFKLSVIVGKNFDSDLAVPMTKNVENLLLRKFKMESQNTSFLEQRLKSYMAMDQFIVTSWDGDSSIKLSIR